MFILFKSTYGVNTIPIKISASYALKCEGPGITKTILEKNRAGGYTLPDFKTYEVTVIKTMWHWPRAREADQENRTESKHSPARCVVTWFMTKGTARSSGKTNLFLLIAAGWLVPIYKKVKFDSYFTLHMKNSRWMVGINVKGKTPKLLEENIKEQLPGLWTGKHFLTRT